MLARSSLSKLGARHHAGRPALVWRVRAHRLPEHDLAAGGARAADARAASDFSITPQIALPRYPPLALHRGADANRNLLARPFFHRLSPFSAVYLPGTNPKPQANQSFFRSSV